MTGEAHFCGTFQRGDGVLAVWSGGISRTSEGSDVLRRVEGAFLAYCIIYDLFDRAIGLSQRIDSRYHHWVIIEDFNLPSRSNIYLRRIFRVRLVKSQLFLSVATCLVFMECTPYVVCVLKS